VSGEAGIASYDIIYGESIQARAQEVCVKLTNDYEEQLEKVCNTPRVYQLVCPAKGLILKKVYFFHTGLSFIKAIF